jgi:hypothetical protein
MDTNYYTDGTDIVHDPTAPSTVWTAGYSSYLLVSSSTDGGASWTRYQLGTGTGRPYAIAIDPSDGDLVYVGGYEVSSPAVYMTSNGGGSWTKLAASGLSGYVYDLAIDPTETSTIFAATGNGIYRSQNGGSSFAKMGTVGYTKTLCFDPADAATIYAGTYSQGAWVSHDGGSSWQEMNGGLDATRVSALAVHPDEWVFAGTGGSSCYRWSLGTGVGDATGTAICASGVHVAPNPVYTCASISFELAEPGSARLAVYDMSGRLVSTLVDGELAGGPHSVVWDASSEGAAAGVYFFRLEASGDTRTGRMVLVR